MKKNNFLNNSFLECNNDNQNYIGNIYQQFINDPNNVSSYWKNFFESNPDFKNLYDFNKNHDININYDKNYQILQFTKFLRTYGHQYANLNPLNKNIKKKSFYEKILHDFYHYNKIENNIYNLDEKIDYFNKVYSNFINIYCSVVGFEYMHIDNIEERYWLQEYIEKNFLKFSLLQNKQKKILNLLIKSEIFEKYLHTKFPGSKRFSLEGCEVLIPLLKTAIAYTTKKNTSKVIIGMAHRGRLNVLVNILKKKINVLCHEFSSNYVPLHGTGDAKYHSGMCTKIKIKNKSITLDLKPNPSHLEIINPVIMGAARAYIDSFEVPKTDYVLPINIHGDASIIGQGVIQELLNMSQTKNYTIGGTLHIIINNQIGFTTSDLKDIRSSRYCTDVAKIIQSPVFHVNADYPESVIFVTKLALNFKYKFKKDVFIDLVCYRRRGHNEADEPRVTQPVMYKKIQQHPTVCQIYHENLVLKNRINENYLIEECKNQRKKISILSVEPIINTYQQQTLKRKKNIFSNFNVKNILKIITHIPENFQVHERVLKIYEERKQTITGKQLFNWGTAENLAYANILSNNVSCRLSGEDVGRGTFFHRHSIIYDQNNGRSYIPLSALKYNSKFYLCNSTLSEEAVLAFEYGYSIDAHNTINIWEAQFGDFSNGAQIVIDQFISSGEQKWGLPSKLVLLLPHGYEGQGPEHSSARLERFLQLSAQNNIKICIPTTTSQMYHLLINQASSNIQIPLIILTPKSLLRNNMTYSTFEDIQNGRFKHVIYDTHNINNHDIRKIIFCSGKIYYELLNAKNKHHIKDIILIRLEQLYPFPRNKIIEILNYYHDIKEISWCQEEPKNQGAWYYIYNKFKKIVSSKMILNYFGRNASASPAVGSFVVHQKQQQKIISDALNIL